MVLYIYKHKGGKYTMRVAIATDSAEKIKGIKKDKTTKQKKNPSVYKIAIIIE